MKNNKRGKKSKGNVQIHTSNDGNYCVSEVDL